MTTHVLALVLICTVSFALAGFLVLISEIESAAACVAIGLVAAAALKWGPRT